jgi:hypothetical protein
MLDLDNQAKMEQGLRKVSERKTHHALFKIHLIGILRALLTSLLLRNTEQTLAQLALLKSEKQMVLHRYHIS